MKDEARLRIKHGWPSAAWGRNKISHAKTLRREEEILPRMVTNIHELRIERG
jgi:hypothetical protein